MEQVPAKYTFVNKYKGSVWGEEYVKVINMSKIVLNLFLNDYDQVKSGVNLRMVEIPACKAFQLSQHIPGIEKFLEVGKEIEIFQDNKQLTEKIDFFLAHDKERKTIAKNSYKKIKELTFANQIKCILKTIEKIS